MFSVAFSFQAQHNDYILRLNKHLSDFDKDRYAWVNYASIKTPVPKILKIGRFDRQLYYCISERCPGVDLNALGEDESRALTPALFDALEAIHRSDVSDQEGWGLTDAKGRGRFESWEAYLRSFFNQKFDFQWPDLIQSGKMPGNLFDEFHSEFTRLLPFCSPTKSLVHGDFGFDNVISDGKSITGVLDWAESCLGDPLYDVAYLDFWSKKIPYGELWVQDALAKGKQVNNFNERLICYMLHIGLAGLAIEAINGQSRAFTRVRERMRSIFSPGRRSPTDWTQ